MANRCKTCAHPNIAEINEAILANASFRSIATEQQLTESSVKRHARSHLKPMVAQVQAVQREAIKAKAVQFNEETLLPVLDKVRLLQQSIKSDLAMVHDPIQRVPIERELRGCYQEEAKILGEYTKDRENQEKEERTVRAVKDWLTKHPEMDRDYVIDTFAEGRGTSRERIIELLGVIG